MACWNDRTPKHHEKVETWIQQGAQWQHERVRAGGRQKRVTIAKLLNVSYGTMRRQKLDVYFSPDEQNNTANSSVCLEKNDDSSNSTNKALIVIHIHGGGWARGAKNQAYHGAPFIARSSVTCGQKCIAVTPNYRRRVYPTFMHDVADAIHWVYENADALGGDKNRIVLSGHSAGGHIVSLLMVRYRDFLQDRVPIKCIQGWMALSGVHDLLSPFLKKDNSDSIFRAAKNKGFELAYIWPAFGLDETVRRQVSPIWLLEQVSVDDSENAEQTTNPNIRPTELPPLLVLNASMDMGLEEHGKRLSKIVEKYTTVYYNVIPATNHVTICWSPYTRLQIHAFLQQF